MQPKRNTLTDEERRDRKRTADKTWQEANKERSKLVKAAWAKNNAAKKKADDRAYYQAHKERQKRLRREYYQRNKQNEMAAMRRWQEQNRERSTEIKKKSWVKLRSKTREKQLAWASAWKARNPERVYAYGKAWRAAHSERAAVTKANGHARRRARLDDAGSFTAQEWKDLLDATGHKCVCCGIPEADALYRYRTRGSVFGKLTKDHIKPLCKGGDNTISNIQPTCLPCNQRKHDKHVNYLQNDPGRATNG